LFFKTKSVKIRTQQISLVKKPKKLKNMVSGQLDRVAESFRPDLTLVAGTGLVAREITQAKVIENICVPDYCRAGVLPHQFRDDKGLVLPTMTKLQEENMLPVPGVFCGFVSDNKVSYLLSRRKDYPGGTLVILAHGELVAPNYRTFRGYEQIRQFVTVDNRETGREKTIESFRPQAILILGTGTEKPSLQQSSPEKGEIVFNIINGTGIKIPF